MTIVPRKSRPFCPFLVPIYPVFLPGNLLPRRFSTESFLTRNLSTTNQKGNNVHPLFSPVLTQHPLSLSPGPQKSLRFGVLGVCFFFWSFCVFFLAFFLCLFSSFFFVLSFFFFRLFDTRNYMEWSPPPRMHSFTLHRQLEDKLKPPPEIALPFTFFSLGFDRRQIVPAWRIKEVLGLQRRPMRLWELTFFALPPPPPPTPYVLNFSRWSGFFPPFYVPPTSGALCSPSWPLMTKLALGVFPL